MRVLLGLGDDEAFFDCLPDEEEEDDDGDVEKYDVDGEDDPETCPVTIA